MNFQNIPRSNKLIKKAIIPKLDVLASFDYEQIEYRFLAYYLAVACDQWRMVEDFRAGKDPHTELAKLLMDNLGIEYSEPITDLQRQVYGKTPNFAIIYAGGRPTIKRQMAKAGIDCDDKQAATILKAIRETMPEVKELQTMIEEEVALKGHIFNLYGRRYHPDPKIPYRDAVRKLLNALIQGVSADLARKALVRVHDGCAELGLESHQINFVHDEILLDVREGELDILARHVPVWMGDPVVSEVVPITTSMEVGPTWADKEAYSA